LSAEPGPLQPPDGVVELLRRAGSGEVLATVESMTDALTETGWARAVPSGSWSYTGDPSWTVESAGHPPSLSIFVRASDSEQEQWSASLHAVLESGKVGTLTRATPAWSWSRWFACGVEFSLDLSRERRLGARRVPAVMQLALERADAPAEGLAPDPWRARRVAVEGSAVARWYLAGEDSLPEDVVKLLAADDDVAVVAALEISEKRRRVVLGED